MEINRTETSFVTQRVCFENETLKFPFIFTERYAKCQVLGPFKLKGLAKAANQKI